MILNGIIQFTNVYDAFITYEMGQLVQGKYNRSATRDVTALTDVIESVNVIDNRFF